MFRRFAAGSAIASMAIAGGAFVILLVPGFDAQRFYPLAFIWCLVPVAWGLWAALAPSSWVPRRLPIWGAVLGIAAGTVAFLVLNLPAHVLGMAVPMAARIMGAVVLAALYFALWFLVRTALVALETKSPAAEKPRLEKAA